MRKTLWMLVVAAGILQSCGIGKSSFNPNKKYSLQEVQKDYSLFQNILEEYHPGLYWYTNKDSMDYFFHLGNEQLHDSMTEPEFKKTIAYVTSKLDCGHTTVRSSKRYSRYLDTLRARSFPLSLKIWPDTAVVAANLFRRDTILKRGTVIKGINNKPIEFITDSLFQFLSADGGNRIHKFQTLSNRANFGTLYTSVFGMTPNYHIDYLDNSGKIKSTTIPVYNPATDTTGRRLIRPIISQPRLTTHELKKLRLTSTRSLQIDSANQSAFMNLNSFSRGYHLRKFFRTSFKTLRIKKPDYLVIDVRGNGGGSVTNSTFFSRFLADHRFKIADSLYAISKKSVYGHYIQNHFLTRLFLFFFTRKKQDGHYHFKYFERHYFKPKNKNHFNGKVYILSGGNSFSATTLFIGSVYKQKNVTLVGEETGGGAYGNTAWLLPDVTLPSTGVRFSLPLFRLVINKNIPKNGRGIIPQIEADPSVDAIRRGADYKMDKVMELIRNDKADKKNQ